MINQVLYGDCLELMKLLDDKSIDMILCDLPYGTTACNWDSIIPFDLLWKEYKRIIKNRGAIVLTASQPFTSKLVISNINMFKYEWIWNKNIPSNFFNAKVAPMKQHENILIFSKSSTIYNPIMETRARNDNREKRLGKTKVFNKDENKKLTFLKERQYKYHGIKRHPSSIKFFKCEKGLHPTQKPTTLFQYLIETYTNENDTVLDNCAGRGTTAIACLNTNRNYILMEKDKEFFDLINNRIKEWHIKKSQMLF